MFRETLTVATILVSGLAVSHEPASEKHRDPRHGFEVTIPKGFDQVPIQSSEPWIIAKFLSDKKEFFTDPTTKYTYESQPEITIVRFLDPEIFKDHLEEMAKREVEKKKSQEKGAKEDEDEAVFDLGLKPYEGYLDYMKRNYKGFFVEEEEEGEHRGLPVTKYVLNLQDTERICAWEFKTDIAKIAVEYQGLAKTADKSQRTVDRLMKSFKAIDRTESLNLSSFSGEWVSALFMDNLTQEERNNRRKQLEESAWTKATTDLPDEWETYEIDGVRVLSRVDKKHATKVVDRILAIYGWLEETFPEVGKGEYVRRPIVRVCEDEEEYRSFRRGTFDLQSFLASVSTDIEIVTYKSDFGAASWVWSQINTEAMRQWFSDRDRDLTFALPPWLTLGLAGMLEGADVRGGKLKFGQSDLEMFLMVEAKQQDSFLPAHGLLTMSTDRLVKTLQDREYGPYVQCTALARYLLDGKGARSKETKDAVPRYLSGLRQVLDQIETESEKDGKAPDKKPANEEEEQQLAKARREAFKSREARILEYCLEATFVDWEDKDWESFDRAFQKSL